MPRSRKLRSLTSSIASRTVPARVYDGLLFDEITASSLVKIDAEGNKVEPSDAEINSGGFAMPSTVHKARPEVACVRHAHSIAGLRRIDAKGRACYRSIGMPCR